MHQGTQGGTTHPPKTLPRSPEVSIWAAVILESGERVWAHLTLWVLVLDDPELAELGDTLAEQLLTCKEERRPIYLSDVVELMAEDAGYWEWESDGMLIHRIDNGPNCVCLIVRYDDE